MGKWPNRDNAVSRKLTRCPNYFCQNLGISPPSLPLVWFKDKVKGPEDERWREHWGSSSLLGSLGNLNIVLDPWQCPTSCIYLSSSHHLLSISVSSRRDGKMPTMLSCPGRLCKVCLVVLNFDIIHQLSDQPCKISFETKYVFTQYLSNMHAYNSRLNWIIWQTSVSFMNLKIHTIKTRGYLFNLCTCLYICPHVLCLSLHIVSSPLCF